MEDLLREVLQNPDSERVQRWKNEMRSNFSNDLGPRMMELIRAKEGLASDRIVLVMVMAEALGDMLAQTVQKTSPTDLQKRTFIGLVEQLKICGLDYLERTRQ